MMSFLDGLKQSFDERKKQLQAKKHLSHDEAIEYHDHLSQGNIVSWWEFAGKRLASKI